MDWRIFLLKTRLAKYDCCLLAFAVLYTTVGGSLRADLQLYYLMGVPSWSALHIPRRTLCVTSAKGDLQGTLLHREWCPALSSASR